MLRVAIFILAVTALITPAEAGIAFRDAIYGTQTTNNIVYGTGLTNNGNSKINLRLDLYRPTDIGEGALPTLSPALVLIHGGGFTGGDKSDVAPLAPIFSSLGYTVISINYRLNGNNPPYEPGAFDDINSLPFTPPPPPYQSLPLPSGLNAVNAAVLDTMKAITWLKTNAGLYNVDPNRIGVGGFSAGAITALLQAYVDPDPATTPKVVLSYLGSMYGTEAVIPANSPPAFIVHGTADTVVPFSGSQAVANKLTSLGVYNEFYAQTGVGHTVDYLRVTNGKTLLEHQIDFLATYLVPEPSTFALAGMGVLALAVGSGRRYLKRKSA